jgi:hypothetical protein
VIGQTISHYHIVEKLGMMSPDCAARFKALP